MLNLHPLIRINDTILCILGVKTLKAKNSSHLDVCRLGEGNSHVQYLVNTIVATVGNTFFNAPVIVFP